MRQLITILCMLLIGTLDAQDPHFSQFYNSPLNLNPALTGFINGQYRVHAIYRDQYKAIQAPYRTLSAAADFRFHMAGDDYYNFGVRFLRDQAGSANFVRTSGHGSFAYRKKLGGGKVHHYLLGGAELGIGQHRIDLSKLWFGQQFDPTLISENFDLDNGEGMSGLSESTNLYADLGAGLSWFTSWGDRKSVVIGLAQYHINQPKVSFSNNDNVKLDPRLVLHVNAEIPISRILSVMPSALYQVQGPHSELLVGTQIRYYQSNYDDTALRLGIWARISSSINDYEFDAVIISGMYEFDQFQFGMSYDVTVSALAQANNSFGGFEFSLTYIFPEDKRRFEVKCPRL